MILETDSPLFRRVRQKGNETPDGREITKPGDLVSSLFYGPSHAFAGKSVWIFPRKSISFRLINVSRGNPLIDLPVESTDNVAVERHPVLHLMFMPSNS